MPDLLAGWPLARPSPDPDRPVDPPPRLRVVDGDPDPDPGPEGIEAATDVEDVGTVEGEAEA